MSPAPQPFELAILGTEAPNIFTAFVPQGEARLAGHRFEWRVDPAALAPRLNELQQAAQAGQRPPDQLHIRFGQWLFDTVFAGPLRHLWEERRRAAGAAPLRLLLRLDPHTAGPLLNLPWEYLHDGQAFLAANPQVLLVRLPWGVQPTPRAPLVPPVRLLVVTASPPGVVTTRIKDQLQLAIEPARQAGGWLARFAPHGSQQAIAQVLAEFDPHLLHFIGQSVFEPTQGRGYLLLGTPSGGLQRVPNSDFAAMLARHGRSLRVVLLNATPQAAPRTDGFADFGSCLLQAGIPAAIAIQYPLNSQAVADFAAAFYISTVQGRLLDEAARAAREKLGPASFAAPAIFITNPACLRQGADAIPPGSFTLPARPSGPAPVQPPAEQAAPPFEELFASLPEEPAGQAAPQPAPPPAPPGAPPPPAPAPAPLPAAERTELRREAGELHQIGLQRLQTGQYSLALQSLQEALDIFDELDDRPGLALCLHALGELYRQLGEYPEARPYYQQALDIFQALDDQAGIVDCLHNLGSLLHWQGESLQAIQLTERALAIEQKLGEQADVAGTLYRLGELLHAAGQRAEAGRRFEQAMAIVKKLGDQAGVAECQLQLGLLEQEQKQFRPARKYYQQSLELRQKLGDLPGTAESLHHLGALQAEQRDLRQARHYFQQALDIWQQLSDRAGQARTLGELGRLEEQEGHLPEAVARLAQSLSGYREVAAPEQAAAAAGLANLYRQMGEAAFTDALHRSGVYVRLEEILGTDTGA